MSDTAPIPEEAPVRDWYGIAPADAVDIVLPRDDIRGPLTRDGKPCPWPWQPQQLECAGVRNYHCYHCGEVVTAGWPHPDYAARKENKP